MKRRLSSSFLFKLSDFRAFVFLFFFPCWIPQNIGLGVRVAMKTTLCLFLLPKTKPSQEGIGVVSFPAARRQLFEFLDIASAQDHVVGVEDRDQLRDHETDMSPPFLLAQALQSTDAQIIFVSCFPVSHVGQLHR